MKRKHVYGAAAALPLSIVTGLLMSLFTAVAIAEGFETVDFGVKSIEEAVKADTDAKSVITNPNRLYPPSCLPEPLPSTPRGPGVSGTINLFGLDLAVGPISQVRLTIWREPCGPTQSAILMQFERISGDLPVIPTFFSNDGTNTNQLRLGTERNTLSANSSLLTNRTTFVVEYRGGSGDIDHNGRIGLVGLYVRDPSLSDAIVAIPPFEFPAYDPSAYGAEVNAPLQFTGHLTGSYFDPAKPGEGMLLEVAEVGGQLVMIVSWYTFDDDGFPLWLVGAAPITPGSRSVEVQLASQFGGRLAGDFDPASLTELPFGTVTLQFQNCRSVQFDYQSTHNLDGFPRGSGSRNWSRLTDIAGHACE